MEEQETIRELTSRVCREALEQKSAELAEELSRRMEMALAAQQPRPYEPIRELRDGAALIAGSRTQTETLDAVLTAAAAITPKCGLMILRGSQAGGWSCKELASPEIFKRTTLDCSRGVAAKVISQSTPAEAPASELDPVFTAKLALAPDDRVLLLPVLLKERVAALLIALGHRNGDLSSLELLLAVAHLALDLQAYRKAPVAAEAQPAAPAVAESAKAAAEASPSATPAQAAARPARAAAAPAVKITTTAPPSRLPARGERVGVTPPAAPPPRVEAAPAAPPEKVVAAPVPAAVDSTPAPVAEIAAPAVPEARVEVAPPPPPPAAAPKAVAPAPPPAQRVVPKPVAAPPAAAQPAPPAASSAASSPTQPHAPAAAAGAPPELREKANRFARLLVDEIKLYNQSNGKFAEGRTRSDIYGVLREDIEKSRAAYNKRYGASVKDEDLFTRELLRILADNNRALMGPDFPG